jgi:hypothetical protein
MKLKLSTLYAAIGLTLLATNALAGTPALTFDSLGVMLIADEWNLGWKFHANANTDVTALGSLTAGVSSYPVQVGLWNSSQTLIGSTYVSPSSAKLNQFSYSSIAPVALIAGSDYYVASAGYTSYGLSAVNASTAPQITFLQDAFGSSTNNNSLVFPNTTDHFPLSNAAFFGANFQVSGVPEPETYAMLLAGLGLIGFIAYRRKNDSSDMPMAA